MKILAIDTSGKTATVAVTEDKELLGQLTLNLSVPHSQIIMVLVEELLEKLKLKPDDIDLFAVSHGPGSFTGLRVGIAAIKGMADALNKPSIGISTLEATALKFRPSSYFVCPIMDARRNQVYYSLYKDGEEILKPDMITIDILLQKLECFEKKIIFTGDCVTKYKELISTQLKDMAIFSEEIYNIPDASSICVLAYEKYSNGNTKDVMPEYIIKPYVEQ